MSLGIVSAITGFGGKLSDTIGAISKNRTRRKLAAGGDKVQIEANEHAERMAAMKAAARDSYGSARRSWFDILIDGVARLPRVMIGMSVAIIFCLFAVMPFILWITGKVDYMAMMTQYSNFVKTNLTLFSVVIGFYFGSRIIEKNAQGIGQFVQSLREVTANKEVEVERVKSEASVRREKVARGIVGDSFVRLEATSDAPQKVRDFVKEFGPMAIALEQSHGIPAAGALAHAALETGWGKHVLVGYSLDSKERIQTNNIFNIKVGSSWEGRKASMRVWEVKDGKDINVSQLFRVYPDLHSAFRDYGELLATNARYQEVLKAETPEEYCERLQAAGYMTDPKAAEKMKKILRRFIYET